LGWVLSPAYDLNPSIDKEGLALNIDTDNNALDYNLVKSVGAFFRLTEEQMDSIITEVKVVVSTWKHEADKISITKREQSIMAKAFNN
jgi:serine/threonine-protein kinase HipA